MGRGQPSRRQARATSDLVQSFLEARAQVPAPRRAQQRALGELLVESGALAPADIDAPWRDTALWQVVQDKLRAFSAEYFDGTLPAEAAKARYPEVAAQLARFEQIIADVAERAGVEPPVLMFDPDKIQGIGTTFLPDLRTYGIVVDRNDLEQLASEDAARGAIGHEIGHILQGDELWSTYAEAVFDVLRTRMSAPHFDEVIFSGRLRRYGELYDRARRLLSSDRWLREIGSDLHARRLVGADAIAATLRAWADAPITPHAGALPLPDGTSHPPHEVRLRVVNDAACSPEDALSALVRRFGPAPSGSVPAQKRTSLSGNIAAGPSTAPHAAALR